ncbi:MAG TPA: acyltransferase family protein [Verrucomicrobiota bacterium]|nr:acyltransferase family protein [Verrucomicrobiota bacterium]
MALRPVVFVGLISYSLYLWHWPVLVLIQHLALTPPGPALRVILMAGAFGLAVLSWWFVEMPFRKRNLCPSQPRMLLAGAAGLAVMFGAGLLIRTGEGFPRRLSSEVLTCAQARKDMAFIHELSVEDVNQDRVVSLGTTDTDVPSDLLVWGDSHAMAAMPAWDAWLRESGRRGVAVTRPSTPPLVNYYTPKGLGREAVPFAEAVMEYIMRNRIPEVVLVGAWRVYPGRAGGGSRELEAAVLETVERLRSSGVMTWMMLEVPRHPVDVPRLLGRARLLGVDPRPYVAAPDGFNGLAGTDSGVIEAVRAAGGRVLDPRPLFQGHGKEPYRVEQDGVVWYRDSNHLTVGGARAVLLPWLRSAMSPTPVAARLRPTPGANGGSRPGQP